MANDAAFRSCLVWLAVTVAVVGLCTQSLRKMMATYLLGMFAVAGVLLPDWEFFDRHVSRWSTPVSFHDMRQQQPHSASAQRVPTTTPPTRSRMYAVRVMVYTAVYGFAFYKWWMFISNWWMLLPSMVEFELFICMYGYGVCLFVSSMHSSEWGIA